MEHPTAQHRRDRLLAQLNDGRVYTANELSVALNVSLRTIYRDIGALRRVGIAIKGQPGTGYQALPLHYLPPLALSADELEALHLGLAVLGEGAEAELSIAANSLADKIDAALALSGAPEYSFGHVDMATNLLSHLSLFKGAVKGHQMVEAQIVDAQSCIMRPLWVGFTGRSWAAIGYNESQSCFMRFNLNDLKQLAVLPQLFSDIKGKRLQDYTPD